MSEKIIKWGFIGCGEVTKYKSGPAFQKIEHSEVVAVMSRDISKAKAYAKERGIAKWYNDAQERTRYVANLVSLFIEETFDAAFRCLFKLRFMEFD